MAETLDVRKAIQTILATKCTDTFFKRAKGTPSGNYLVWSYDSVLYDENRRQGTLEIYVNGYGEDTSSVETLADELWEMLDHYYYKDDNTVFVIYPNTRNVLDNDDTKMITRRLLFSINVY